MVVKFNNYTIQEPASFASEWVTVGTTVTRQLTLTWDRYYLASFKNALTRVFQVSPPSFTVNFLDPVTNDLADLVVKPYEISAPVLSESEAGVQLLGPVRMVLRQ